jgi:hypothetical protein
MCTIVMHYKVNIYIQVLCAKCQNFDTTSHMCIVHWLNYDVDKCKNTHDLVQQDPSQNVDGYHLTWNFLTYKC